MGRAKNKKRDFQRKAPLGQGKSARSERKKKKRAQQELQAQLGQLHQAKKRKLQQAGVATGKSTGFAQAISGKSRVNEENLLPLKRFFWPEPKPQEEPDDQLKLLRKNLGIKVKGSPIPSPVEQLADSRLPAEFGLFFKGPRGRKLTKPTPIQMQVWPAALCGLDIMGIAPTGSGKTLAYLLPAAVHVAGQESKKENLSPGALVLLPTRELASQVSDQFNGKGGLRQVLKLRCAAIYGGVGKEVQLDQILTSGCPEVLSATPGRLLDLLGLDALTLDSVTFLVLDEADRMLQLGFEEQLDAVAKAVRRDRQCLLFSATFPERLRQAADRWMTFPEKTVIRVGAVDVGMAKSEPDEVGSTDKTARSLPEAVDAVESTGSTGSTLTVSKNITQMVHVCAEHKKFRKLARFMDKIRQKEKEERVRQKALVIIFCNKIQTLKSVSGFLRKHKHHCEALHSGIPQAKRENALNMFKAGQMQVLVATDVAARGLHVKHLRYVVNYDFPSNLEQYCHRIGRTGRDGEAGTAYSFFTRNLAPLSRDLVQLLERSDQEVDPNLRALAEGKVQQPGEKSSAEEEASEEVVDEASADEAPPMGPSGGGLRITPRKRGGVEDESSEEVSEGPSGVPVAPKAPKSGPKKAQKKVKRRRKGGAKKR